MKKVILFLIFSCLLHSSVLLAQITVSGSKNADGDYESLTNLSSGAFTKINEFDQSGRDIVINITGNSTSETGVSALKTGTWNSILIYPSSSGLEISGDCNNPLLTFNGSDNVIIDGRVNSTGSIIDLTINNTSTGASASTIFFVNSSENNIVKFCNLKGSGLGSAAGTIFFSTAIYGNGNSNNVIENNNISGNNDDRPVNSIYSNGSSGMPNVNNIIRSNNIYNYLNKSLESNGIYLYNYCSSWTITGNCFFENSLFSPLASSKFYGIRIRSYTGINFTISDNYIGGSEPLCGGAAWTKQNTSSNEFTGIYALVGTSIFSNIDNNIIRNFHWNSSLGDNWTGITVADGNINIGTLNGNIIGNETGTNSIILSSETNNNLYGIYISGNGTVNCSNNKIGSLSTENQPNQAGNIFGIYKSSSPANVIISDNSIGSEITLGSINANSSSLLNPQSVYGIYSAGAGSLILIRNTIANLNNNTSSTEGSVLGKINGITAINGSLTISDNVVRDLTIKNANIQASNNASVCGISLSGSKVRNITGNEIYNLANSSPSFTGSVIGLYFMGGSGNVISSNFIHDLSVGQNSSASIYGIRIASGTSTYSNNIISLGGNNSGTIYGIYQTGAVGNDNNIYFNTVYISGNVSGVTSRSYALYSTGTSNNRDFRNNILVNARSTSGSVNLHHSLYIAMTGGILICNHNNYFATGEGGVPGYYGVIKTSLPIVTDQDAGSVNIDPLFALPGGTSAGDYIPADNYLLAAIVGTGILTDFVGASRNIYLPSMGAYEISAFAKVEIYRSGVLSGGYSTLRESFDALNSGLISGGDIEIRIYGNTIEYSSAILNASGTGSANYNTVTIFPASAGLSISGNLASPLIDLNGADKVVIDGRVMQSGVADLTIINSSTSSTAGTSTIRFINDATNNIIKYCNIKGSASTGANIFFSTTTGEIGNDYNTIDNNYITNTDDTKRPLNILYSSGTALMENSSNVVSNNHIFNFFRHNFASNGINLSANNSSWTISGNSFYETTSFVPAASVAYNAIIVSSPTGVNFAVLDNFIGGSSDACGGSPWTKTSAFNNVFSAIYINAGTGTFSNIQNNTIRNFNWSNSLNGSWKGISVAGGDVNVGTSIGNTVGSDTGNGSILVSGLSTNLILYGIYISGSGRVECRNNRIGSIIANNDPANASNIYGIYKNASTGTITISNNTIGSKTTSASIVVNSASTSNAQNLFGIYNSGLGTGTISGNTIANLLNNTNNAIASIQGKIHGISVAGGLVTISNNLIHDLQISNANSVGTNNASVCGISLLGTTTRNISGNEIYNLRNTLSAFKGSVIGLYFRGGFGNNITSNFIHDLAVEANSAASIFGIKIASGTSTYANNIISLGGNTTTNIYGIYQTGLAGNDNSLYFNTVFIGGNSASGTNRSYALYSTGIANIRDFRNNLFINERSTDGGSSLHYALYIAAAGGTLTCDYNDYFVSGTGGILGRFGTNKTALPIVTGQDLNSFNMDPVIVMPGSFTATDYKISEDLIGVSGTGITTDYSSASRNNPTVGAWERVVNKWIGTISTSYNVAGNWSGNSIPVGNNPSIIFDDFPVNHCYLDIDRTFINITSGQPNYRLVTNGHKLTIKGNLIFTGGAQIDASAPGSTVEYAALAVQTIESGQFLGSTVNNLNIANPFGVTLNCDFTVDNSMIINTGKLFSISPARLLTVKGPLTNNAGIAGLIIRSDATGDGKLINNTSNVPATVELYLTGGIISPTVGIYHYIVPPVESMSIGTVPTIDEVKSAFEITNFTGNLLCFNEPATITSQKQGWQYFDNFPGNPPGFTSVISARGYNINLQPGADILKFKGEMNSGEHTFNISYTPGNYGAGWNLVGNPFPCDYDLNGVAGLGTVLDGMSNTIYYNNNGTYGYWNVLTNTGSSAGYTDILPPMTGFYVVATNSNFPSLVLPVSSKSAISGDNRSQHKGNILPGYEFEKTLLRKVKLTISKESKFDEAIIILADDAKMSYNEHYDAFKLFNENSTAPGIYSNINGTDYFMKAVNGPVNSPVMIPLIIRISEAGTHEISVKDFDNINDIKVSLIHGDNKTTLDRNTIYSFTSGAGTFTDFKLVFGETGTENAKDIQLNEAIKTWYRDQFLYINSVSEDFSGNCKIQVFDVQGKPVFIENNHYLVSGQTNQIPVELHKGIYILTINANYRSTRLKFVVF